jgi:dihydropteroate synthase
VVLTSTISAPTLCLGEVRYDLSRRALVMGILNRTPDSFYDKGANFAFDKFLEKAEEHVASGADLLDVGGVKAGPGEEVSEGEELDRVVGAVEALAQRFALPISVDTWRATVAREAYRAGAILGNDISGFADPDYLAEAARVGASVVATHIRLRPRVADPDPRYPDVLLAVEDFLVDRAHRALDAGISAERIIVDAGLDLGKTAAQSIELLRGSQSLASLGFPLLLSASNKTCLGVLLDLEITERREASLSATAMGILRGCRVLRVHDVGGTVAVRDAIESVLSAP